MEQNFNEIDNQNNIERDNNMIEELIKKIEELPLNKEVSIAQLINYNPQEKSVSSLAQGKILNELMKICEQKKIYILENDEINGLAFFSKFKKVDLNIINEMKRKECMESNDFKINDNLEFDSNETKIALQEYLDEVNEYNRKIQNCEVTNINMNDLLNKYRENFYDEVLENRLKEIEKNNEESKYDINEIEELINKIENKIKEIDENN